MHETHNGLNGWRHSRSSSKPKKMEASLTSGSHSPCPQAKLPCFFPGELPKLVTDELFRAESRRCSVQEKRCNRILRTGENWDERGKGHSIALETKTYSRIGLTHAQCKAVCPCNLLSGVGLGSFFSPWSSQGWDGWNVSNSQAWEKAGQWRAGP